MAASLEKKMFDRLWVFLCLLSPLFVVEAKPKHVTVTLDAKWKSTPIVLEASEYLAKQSPEYFWRFVDEMARLKPDMLAAETDESMHHLVKKLASKVLSPLQLQLLQLSLSLRYYSPTIQMYQQMALENSPQCATFVKISGKISCSTSEIEDMLAVKVDDDRSSVLYKFDHVYPDTQAEAPMVFLYAEIGKDKFQEFHQHLKKLANAKKIQYIFRHYVGEPLEQQTRLSGYGVELAIKSTEYKAKDDTKVEGEVADEDKEDDDGEDEVEGFIFSKLRELYPDKPEDLTKFKNHLVESTTVLTPLKVWQLQDLSFQAAQTVLSASSSEALKVLADISQNFPLRAKSLASTTVNNDVRKEMQRNQEYFERHQSVSPGESAMYLNGLPIDMEIYDIFTLLDIMSSEARMMEGLFALGFEGDYLKRLIRLDLKSDAENFALDIRHHAVKYVNDLENERRYKNWPSSIQDILRPTFPGMLRHLSKNIFHLVFMVDPIKEEGRELLKVAEAFNVHSAPIRIGVVFVVDFNPELTGEMDAGIALVRAFEYIKQEEDESKALSFITDVYEKVKEDEITSDIVTSVFVKKYPGEDLVAIFGADSEYDSMRKSAHDFISQSGLSDFPQVLMNGIPLKKESLTMENFEEGVVAAILQATPVIQKAAYDGSLHDNIVVLDWLMEKDNVMPRLNSRVLSPTISTLDFTENTDEMIFEDVDTFRMMSSKDMTSILSQNMKYLTRKDEETVRAVTMWIVCDLETPIGRDLLYSALKNLKSSHELRLGVLFNPSDVEDSFISTAIYVALTTLENQLARSLITKLVKEENVADLKSRAKTIADLEVHGMDMEAYVQALKEQTTDFLTVHSTFVRKVLKFPAGRRGIVTNGKVIGPFEESEEFNQQDIELQEKYIYQQSAKRIREQIKKLGIVGDQGSDLLMKVAALLTSKTTADSRKDLHYHANVHSAVKIPSESSSPAFQIEAILDPLSTDAQKMAPMLMVLKEVANVDITIFMNSRSKLSDMPLKNFYRYVLEPTLQFKADGSLTAGPLAKFVDLPHKSLLTLGMNPPESWLVEAVRSPYDLDNILLEEVEYGVTGEFDLEYILLEGHCHDATTGQPPRGLQFTLSAKNNPVVMDTIVMANLGYFQLKANPGVWHLQMREGRSSEIYSISGHEYTDTPEGADDIVVTIGNFKSKTIRVKVNKKTGMEDEDLLADEEEDDSTGLWGSLSSTLTGSVKEDDKDATLNIFSLASGHLYERLLRIMMLSVLKQTKMKVKFWFLKNYLSPTFKDFIPHMAENYGFQYELVQYKWPRWLTQQKEKQRIIWGYKILFLDVLFPLDVKKIIFVDADQIVRTDLQELNDFDLQGAPYGYTPFCSDRKEMDGFRFWKSGYWASHLAGRKYHISALYVVDLKKFRRVAAGDRLRGQYQGLSQDPNSLSNLDQDLPNNMIHQVKIKSLPQEWLWCETWCSDQSKAAAKTIDLCNNPLTKEPKLQAAMRIVPEWKNYDYEIKVLWDEIYGTNTQSQIEYEPPVLDNISDKKKEEL